MPRLAPMMMFAFAILGAAPALAVDLAAQPSFTDPASGNGYYYDRSGGLYYDPSTDWYYDPVSGAFSPGPSADTSVTPLPPQPLQLAYPQQQAAPQWPYQAPYPPPQAAYPYGYPYGYGGNVVVVPDQPRRDAPRVRSPAPPRAEIPAGSVPPRVRHQETPARVPETGRRCKDDAARSAGCR